MPVLKLGSVRPLLMSLYLLPNLHLRWSVYIPPALHPLHYSLPLQSSQGLPFALLFARSPKVLYSVTQISPTRTARNGIQGSVAPANLQ